MTGSMSSLIRRTIRLVRSNVLIMLYIFWVTVLFGLMTAWR